MMRFDNLHSAQGSNMMAPWKAGPASCGAQELHRQCCAAAQAVPLDFPWIDSAVSNLSAGPWQ